MEPSPFTSKQPTIDGAPSSQPGLERLRKQVDQTAQEISRLRAENRMLKQRVRELEHRPDVGTDEAFVKLHDPEALRTQIEGFINTIDAYLGNQDASSDEPAQ